MAEKTNIEWSDSTWNPWIGCQAISPACDHCYAADWVKRYGRDFAQRTRTSAENWKLPLKWNALRSFECSSCHWRGTLPGVKCDGSLRFYSHSCGGDLFDVRRRVFCASLADVFDNEVPDQWRHDLFALIHATPNLDWLLLTKRIGNVSKVVDKSAFDACPNIWLGATICNQEEADRDIPKLLATPARVRFLSIEPMLGPIDLRLMEVPDVMLSRAGTGIDWVIAGGESGPKARPSHPEWFRGLRDQCAAARMPLLFKQWGSWAPGRPGDSITDGIWMHPNGDTFSPVDGEPFYPAPLSSHVVRLGKKAAGRLLDGVQHDGFPKS